MKEITVMPSYYRDSNGEMIDSKGRLQAGSIDCYGDVVEDDDSYDESIELDWGF